MATSTLLATNGGIWESINPNKVVPEASRDSFVHFSFFGDKRVAHGGRHVDYSTVVPSKGVTALGDKHTT